MFYFVSRDSHDHQGFEYFIAHIFHVAHYFPDGHHGASE